MATVQNTILFSVADVDGESVVVRGLRLQEGLNRSYVAEVGLEVHDDAVDPATWIRQQAVLAIFDADNNVLRKVVGLVQRIRHHADLERHRIDVTIESPLAVLRHVRDFRLYQEMTTEQIVGAILEEAGIPSSQVSFRLTEKYVSRVVCTQFGETSFDFVSRLLEEEGIFYFFEATDDGVTIVFGDDASAYQTTDVSIPFRQGAGLAGTASFASAVTCDGLRPAKVTLRDHDFTKPALDLEATEEDGAAAGREWYDYPGRYTDQGEGARRANVRLSAFAQRRQMTRFTGNAWSVAAGHTFSVAEAPDASLERGWVARELSLSWEQAHGAEELRVEVLAHEDDVAFRPPAVTPRAVVPGPQLAKVRGPAGSEIHCDEHGRVKVSFIWDRRSTQDDKSSAWVRVGQQFMSGGIAIPRVGWEVLVDFEDGDPDRPIVIGRLYNGIFTPPYTLPDCKTMTGLQSKSSPGGGGTNEIRLEDAAGDEQVMTHAEKDQNLTVANNRTEDIAVDEGRVVGNNQSITIGANRTEDIGASHQFSLRGSQSWTVGGSRTKTVSAAEKVDVTGTRSLTIGGSHTQLTPMTVSMTTAGSFSETVGGSEIEGAAQGVSVAVAGAASVTVGAAKIEASGSGASQTTIGAHATTVGGALICAAGGDMSVGSSGVRATTVGGAWVANAGADVQLSASSSVSITVGGAVAFNAGKIVMKVGGSNVTVASGGVSIKSSTIKLTSTGPAAQLAPLTEDK